MLVEVAVVVAAAVDDDRHKWVVLPLHVVAAIVDVVLIDPCIRPT